MPLEDVPVLCRRIQLGRSLRKLLPYQQQVARQFVCLANLPVLTAFVASSESVRVDKPADSMDKRGLFVAWQGEAVADFGKGRNV